MERITVNLADGVGAKLKAKADAEKRSTSSYVELLIEEDLRAAGFLTTTINHAPLMKKIEAAITDDRAVVLEIEKLLRKTTRRRRAA